MNALIIDDEPLAHKVILQYAADIPFLNIVGQCYKATEAYAFLDRGGIDLVFLDINMPRLKGLDFLRTLQHPPRVIITSAYEEYALEGYELRVTDYLLKPFRFERFLQAVNSVRATLAPRERPETRHGDPHQARVEELSLPPAAHADGSGTDKYLFIKVDKRQIRMPLEEIHCLESYGNYVKVWYGRQYHLTPRTLTSFVADLPADFARVHKSFIVARRHIDYVEGALIALRGGKVVPVGKKYRPVVRDWFG